MNNHIHSAVKVHNFSLAFEQMCSMVAIGQTQGSDETLRQLILQCLVLLQDEKFSSSKKFTVVLEDLFGLQIPDHEIEYSIDRMLTEGILRQTSEGYYILLEEVRNSLQDSINNSYQLEQRVRDVWEEEIFRKFPTLSLQEAWKALRNYLAKAFQRHGMQTVALLDPLLDIAPEYLLSLSELLDEAVSEFPVNSRNELKNCVSGFLATIGIFPDRALYISQLADGAFSYFSLTVEYDIAEQFRKTLNPLTLFLDTNFLIGILDLDINPQVAVSNELISAIHKYNFPFELTHHKRTEQELLTSISNYEAILKSQHLSRSISRAATTSRFLSGVEAKYHQQFAENGIDVESFFKPYRHADILLEQRNIKQYQPDSNRLEERTELINEYKDFLAVRNKKKSYNLIDHDMQVLDVVRLLRSQARSTLEAGALFITRDYLLYRFDWESSRKKGIFPCTSLPNMFWQILRPFIPSDVDFSRSFAETFAIPEFRSIGSGASDACSKMLNILASYKDFPEETARRMLSNDLLIDHLRKIDNDAEFQEYVESAIVAQNAELTEEMAILTNKLEEERTEKSEIKQQLVSTSSERDTARSQAEEDKLRHDEELAKKDKRIEELSEEAKKERTQRQDAEKKHDITKTILLVIFALLSSGVSTFAFEFLTYRLPWNWLVNHPNSYGLQISFDLVLLFSILGLFVKKWRNIVWKLLVLPIILGLIQLLGGPLK